MDDSPAKKKRRKNSKSYAKEVNRQCIIHVKANVKDQPVTLFSENSWQVWTYYINLSFMHIYIL